MTPGVTVDLSYFSHGIRFLSKGVPAVAVGLVNQWALDIIRGMFNALPPQKSAIGAVRQQIKTYMWTQLSTRLKLTKGGKLKKARVRRRGRGKATRQLSRVHLIVQTRRVREGKRGLYGKEMMKHAGAFAARAQRSVGYLMVVLLPIIRTLNPLVKYKMPFAETGNINPVGKQFTSAIAIWPGGHGYGRVYPAVRDTLGAWLHMRWSLHGTGIARAEAYVTQAFEWAVRIKAGKVQRQMEREFQKLFNTVSHQKLAA